ncbi:hypothetical protein DASC09_026080 [Saccharomycopsis crataegensis]|uniref:CFEM domain-containing protein n=1 Tax=Saccharomycopsis crataegensis TaxID=43959 RepID=A0AAV5QKA5_9ASCO|nr:hypothetical protein DASC09_026080 [Saccharomycopsis crataegensis]
MKLITFSTLFLAIVSLTNADSPPACLLACVSSVIKSDGRYTFNQQQSICKNLSSDIVECFSFTCPTSDLADDATSYLKSICASSSYDGLSTVSSTSEAVSMEVTSTSSPSESAAEANMLTGHLGALILGGVAALLH